MSPQLLGILVGGIVPAFMFSFSNLSMKASTNQGIGLPMYVILAGIGIFLVGCALFLFLPSGRAVTFNSGMFAFGGGLAWGVGVACVVLAMQAYNAPLSVVTPLFNTNTLISVLLALWIFAEWKQVQSTQLLLGTVLIVAGSVLVARA